MFSVCFDPRSLNSHQLSCIKAQMSHSAVNCVNSVRHTKTSFTTSLRAPDKEPLKTSGGGLSSHLCARACARVCTSPRVPQVFSEWVAAWPVCVFTQRRVWSRRLPEEHVGVISIITLTSLSSSLLLFRALLLAALYLCGSDACF